MHPIKQDKDMFPSASFGVLSALVGAAAVLSTGSGCNQQKAPVTEAHSQDHTGSSHGDHSHHAATTNSMLMIATNPAPVTPGVAVSLHMMIHQPNGAMVRKFELTHEKLVHLIVVSEGLEHFAHVHPDVDKSGNFSTQFTFPSSGKYLLFADHKASGEQEATARGELQVGTGVAEVSRLEPNAPGRVSGDSLTADVTIGIESAGSRKITFEISDASGKPVTDLEQYLGAMGHLVIISADGSKYVHAHPNENGQEKAGHVSFEAHFTSPGTYKGWGQFQRGGEVRTIPFVVRIEM
jgi:hypothetical protein